LAEEKSDVTMVLIGLAIGLLLGGIIGYLYSADSPQISLSGGGLTAEEVGIITEEYIIQNLVPEDITVSVDKVTEKSGVYELEITLTRDGDSQKRVDYVSKDGDLLFSLVVDMSRETAPEIPGVQPDISDVLDIDMMALTDDDPRKGSDDAPVIIVEFSDFQCPFCAQATVTIEEVVETYGDNVLLVYRDFPLHSIHPEAGKAAEAAQCAFEQDKFWEYHDILFEKQREWSGVGVPKFKEYAVSLSLDSEAFNTCLDSGVYTAEVEADLQEGTHFGVTGTPAFFINGRKVSGAQPFSAFQQIIDEELATS
jgi:protein-disulfide isomerase